MGLEINAWTWPLKARVTTAFLAVCILLTACGGQEPEPDNQVPTARLEVSASSGEAPLEIQFSALDSNDPDGALASYQWDFGDGGAASEAVVSHTFTEAGSYSVSLTVTDDSGESSTETAVITVVASNARFSVYGTVLAMPYVDVDGDTNDPAAPLIANDGNSADEVQPLGNPVLLSGYLTASATGVDGDRFQFNPDPADLYEVTMEAEQYVSLQMLAQEQADIDLYLLDQSSFDVVASSVETGEFESLRVPASGSYFLLVQAVQGASRYLLKVGYESLKPGSRINGDSGQFVPMEAVVKFNGRAAITPNIVLEKQLNVTHLERDRETLTRINPLNPQTRNRMKLAHVGGFEHFLAREHPAALTKLKTVQAVKSLRQDAEVSAAELNYRVQAKLRPNDPYYSLQWHYPVMNLPQAWDVSTGQAGVTVAVVDTGVLLDHPELEGVFVDGYDFISSPSNSQDGDGIDPDPSDAGDGVTLASSSWHGTSIAGALAARMNNGEGITGVAPGVMLMPIRALGTEGGSVYDLMQSVRYAAGLANDSGRVPAKPADVINMSLGGPGYSQFSQDLYRQVQSLGIFVVAAAGNDNSSENFYPASYEGVISVAALDFADNRAYYSNYNDMIDIAAPGGDLSRDRNRDGYGDGVLSLNVSVSFSGALGPDYAYSQGTSIAAPQVSGVIALMKSVYPDLTPTQFDSLLINSELTRDLGTPGRDNEFGYGAIDALAAIQAAEALADGDTTAAIVADPATLVFDYATDTLTLTVSLVGNGSIAVASTESLNAWLGLEPTDVDGNGLGSYTVTVDRSGLPQGNYTGQLIFNGSDGSTLEVKVNLRVGDVVETGNAGMVYIMLVDATTQQPVANLLSEGAAGEYPFVFPDVPAGDYYLMAGTDVNRDGLICDAGEICGYYPSFAQRTIINLTSDKPNMNFVAGLYGGAFEAAPVATSGAVYFAPLEAALQAR